MREWAHITASVASRGISPLALVFFAQYGCLSLYIMNLSLVSRRAGPGRYKMLPQAQEPSGHIQAMSWFSY